MILKFLDFQYVFVNVLLKISSNCMSGLFCIANLLEIGRKKIFFKISMDFKLLRTKMM